MPLIRYRTGDRAILETGAPGCACGRALPLLGAIDGRSDDVLYTRDGRRVGRLDPIFKASLPLHEAQIVQETLDRVRVLYVPDRGFTPQSAADLVRLLRDRMGPVDVALEAVDRVPRGANGKFRAVVCQLPPDVIAAIKAMGSEAHAAR
jgi:phenylacetate-CoA ligase